MKIRVDGPDLKLVVAWTEHLTYLLFSLLGRVKYYPEISNEMTIFYLFNEPS